MAKIAFSHTSAGSGGIDTVVAYRPGGGIKQADERHPHFQGIVKALNADDESVWDLFDVGAGIVARFKQVTERISWDGSNVFFDGEPVHSALSDQLSRALNDGDGEAYTAIAKFWEKLASNPTKHSRDQAYDWLSCHKFQITGDGDVVGYKYVNRVGDGYESVASSQVPNVPSGFVNGVPVPERSRIPQKVGDVVTMPRGEVAHDPSQACKRGLHVGTFGYVGGYHRTDVLEVHVNPRDIVSVPSDGGGQKVRVCRYFVAAKAGNDAPAETVLRSQESESVEWVPDVSYRGD